MTEAIDTHPRPVSVTVIVPCRNERAHIETFLDSATRQEDNGLDLEFIVADGRSDDGTRGRLERHAETHPAWRVIDNPGLSVSAGLNLAIHAARGDVVVRMDVHTEYAPDYVRQSVAVLFQTGADNVGGPARTKADGYVQRAIALGYHARFSTGGARFHDPDFEGDVDTVTYGCWRKARLMELGLFDETLVRNQDDELNLRIHRAGGRVYQSPAIRSWYYPRTSLGALFEQYRQYGYWKVRVIQKHGLPASWRHLVPGAFVAVLIVLTILAPFSRVTWVAWLGLAGAYLCATVIASVATCAASTRLKFLPVMPLVFAAFHLGYGYGFLRGVIDFGLLNRGVVKAFSRLTRRDAA